MQRAAQEITVENVVKVITENPDIYFEEILTKMHGSDNPPVDYKNKLKGVLKNVSRSTGKVQRDPATRQWSPTGYKKAVKPQPVRNPKADQLRYSRPGVSIAWQGRVRIAPHYRKLWSEVSVSMPLILPQGLVWVGDDANPNGSWTSVALKPKATVCFCEEIPDFVAYPFNERFVKFVELVDSDENSEDNPCTIYKLEGDFKLFVER